MRRRGHLLTPLGWAFLASLAAAVVIVGLWVADAAFFAVASAP